MEKKNKKPLVFISLLIIALFVIGVTIAYYTSSDTFNNEFNASEYVMEVEETFESPDNWTPGTTTPKEVIATNRGDVPAAVRVRLTPTWVASDGVTTLPLTDGTNEAAIINFAYDADIKWVKDGDWYYYIRPIDKDESTTSLLESVTFNPNVNINSLKDCDTDTSTGVTTCTTEMAGYGDATYKLKVEIETAQYNKYKEIWGTTTDITSPTHVNGRLMDNSYTSRTFGKNISRDSFESVMTLDVISIPNDAVDSWDCSEEQNEAVMCWYTDKDNDSKYELYIGQEGGVVANPQSTYAFAKFKNAEMVSLLNVDATQIVSMYNIFDSDGYNVTNFKFDASDWDVSNVTSANSVFVSIGYNSKNIDVKVRNWKPSSTMDVTRAFAWMGRNSEHVKFDLTGWNFTNVKSIEGFFYDFVDACLGTSCPTAELILDGWNTSGVENMQDVFNHSFYYVKDVNLDLRGWDVSSVTNMQGMFTDIANTGKGSLTINLTGWNTSNVINMDHMFSFAGCYIGEYDHPGSKISLIGLSNWNVSNVTKMGYLFSNVGLYAETVEIGNLSSWNTSNVTTMEAMFDNFGYRANKVDIGSLNVYATNIKYFAEYAASLNGIINIYSNPTSYNYAFKDAATLSGTGLTVNYASTTTNIDNIVATKSNNSNVVKGSQLN